MKTKTAKTQGDLKELTPIAERWIEEADFERFGLDRNLMAGMKDLGGLITGQHTDLIMLIEGDKTVGFIGVKSFMSPLGDNLISEEHYFYVLPKHRGRGGLILIDAVKEWAKQNMCTHLILNASCLASGQHDRICELYERMGMIKFETSYVAVL